MPCTTLLVGKNASITGATLVARNDDCSDHEFDPKRIIVVGRDQQDREYTTKITGVHLTLPEHNLRYTATPHVVPDRGIWAAAGVNEAGVSMTATETITSNDRVRGVDPLLEKPDGSGDPDGIAEEDFIVITLPYIRSAREGVQRLGSLLEQYGTYEMNGIGFQDVNEIWWFETIGGHHWMAARVPDDRYVVMPNQLGIDFLDFNDAEGAQENYMCSPDLRTFILENHLDASIDNSVRTKGTCNPRVIFGSHEDADHVYNTPRAWDMERYLNPTTVKWFGPDAEYTPESDNLPWSMVPEYKLGVYDVKKVLSLHYQGTEYDPYGIGPEEKRHHYRPCGINRTRYYCCVEMRPDMPAPLQAIQWITFGSNVFNALVPFYPQVETVPAYYSNTTTTVDSAGNFYWANRLIAVLADMHYNDTVAMVERYQTRVQSHTMYMLHESDKALLEAMAAGTGEAAHPAEEIRDAAAKAVDGTPDIAAASVDITAQMEETNQRIADFTKAETDKLLSQVLFESSLHMNNEFARADV